MTNTNLDRKDTPSPEVGQVLDLMRATMDNIVIMAKHLSDLMPEAMDAISQEIVRLLDMMYEVNDDLCVSCRIGLTNKYAECVEPLMKECKELEIGDRIISASD